MILNAHREFLLNRTPAGQLGHSGRTLFQHLVGTQALLAAWDAREPVQWAGLFHSIYGTRSYRKQAWPLSDRATIRALIGDEAEGLAYKFGVLDRGSALFLLPDTPTLKDLREIEAANLIEQGSHSDRLKRLFASDISIAAAAAIARHMAGAA